MEPSDDVQTTRASSSLSSVVLVIGVEGMVVGLMVVLSAVSIIVLPILVLLLSLALPILVLSSSLALPMMMPLALPLS